MGSRKCLSARIQRRWCRDWVPACRLTCRCLSRVKRVPPASEQTHSRQASAAQVPAIVTHLRAPTNAAVVSKRAGAAQASVIVARLQAGAPLLRRQTPARQIRTGSPDPHCRCQAPATHPPGVAAPASRSTAWLSGRLKAACVPQLPSLLQVTGVQATPTLPVAAAELVLAATPIVPRHPSR